MDLRTKPNYQNEKAEALAWVAERKESLSKISPCGKFRVGDVIKFVGGYNNDIEFISEITGFTRTGDAYIVWDCYWFPIMLNDKTRTVELITQYRETLKKETVAEMFETLDTNIGDHAFVAKYKGVVSDDIISRVIESWACSLEKGKALTERFWELHLKLLTFNKRQI